MRLRRRSNDAVVRINQQADKLGEGGEGAVYRVGTDLVAKIYKKEVREARAKIEAMVQNPPDDSATKDHRSIAWPVDILVDADRRSEFRGYLMPRVGSAVELHRIFELETRVKLGYTTYELHVIALNIASAVQALHQKGYVIGDVNDRNVLINERGLTTVIDTDSFQVPRSGGGAFRCGVCTGEFTPPELQQVEDFRKVDRREEHDLFGLGVLLFKVLMLGHHPFSGRTNDTAKQGWPLERRIVHANFPFGPTQSPFSRPPGAAALDVLAPELQDMCVACFDSGKRTPRTRPRAGEWRAALNRARKDLETCAKNPHHRFGSHLDHCPWCEIRDRVKVNGKGMDYFPLDSTQIPIVKPARPKQKLKVRQVPAPSRSSASRPGSSMTGLPSASGPSIANWNPAAPGGSSGSSSLAALLGTPPAASRRSSGSGSGLAALLSNPPQPAPASPPQTSTPGIGELLGSLALNVLSNWANRAGSGPAATPAQPEFGPGRWQFQRNAPLLSMTPILVQAEAYFDPAGNFFGNGVIQAIMQRVPCALAGRWHYDTYGKVLTVDTQIDGMPVPREQLRIIGGGNGQFRMVGAAGVAVAAVRLA